MEHTRKAGSKTDGKSGSLDYPPAQPPKCPECTSQKVWKDGLRRTRNGDVQRYLCRSCGYRFSESEVKVNVSPHSLKCLDSESNLFDTDVAKGDFPIKEGFDSLSFQRRENVASHVSSKGTVAEKGLNTFGDYSRNRRVCASEREAKNLVKVETRTQKQAAGATIIDEATMKGKLIEYLWYLKKQGYQRSTIETKIQRLKRLVKLGADLSNPETVKKTIANDEWSNSYKANMVAAYANFAEMIGAKWQPPDYKPVQKLPFVPHEKEIDALIAGCGKKVATSLQLLKETGMRIGETWNLEWTDIDSERCTVTCTPEKNGRPRQFKVSGKLIAMLNMLPKRGPKVFGGTSLIAHRYNFTTQRKRLVKKLHNPRLQKISFHTFRHWKATMEYHRTKDIMHVKELLGHRQLSSTMIYTHLVSFESDDYHVKTAKTLEEACELAEAGFSYFTEIEGVQVFRKPK